MQSPGRCCSDVVATSSRSPKSLEAQLGNALPRRNTDLVLDLSDQAIPTQHFLSLANCPTDHLFFFKYATHALNVFDVAPKSLHDFSVLSQIGKQITNDGGKLLLREDSEAMAHYEIRREAASNTQGTTLGFLKDVRHPVPKCFVFLHACLFPNSTTFDFQICTSILQQSRLRTMIV